MKTGIVPVILVLGCAMAMVGLRPAFSETIYTIDGEVIQAKISEKTEAAIWYEIPQGDMVEYIGINISDVEKILNDDGSVYEHSPGR